MRNALATVFVVSVVAASLAAQADKQKPSAPSSVSKITISGCIQSTPPASTAAAPSASTSKYELTMAKLTSGAPVGTAGANDLTSARYGLQGDDKTISPHVGHKVEITGIVTPASATDTDVAVKAPTLKVDSLKMVSTKCE